MWGSEDIGLLVGKTIKKITDSSDELLFECTDESAFRQYHMQDCCEQVVIYDINGGLHNLIGEEIVYASVYTDGDWPSDVPTPECLESFTWTIVTLKTANAEVVIRWLGQSNGYYSESVYFQRTHTPIELS